MILLIKRAEQFLDRTAIISDGQTYQYVELLESSRQIAKRLLINTDDLSEQCIAFMVPPSFDYVAVQWGIWRAGGIAVPLAISHPLSSIRHVLEDAEIKLLIIDQQYEKFLQPLIVELDIVCIIVSEIKEELPVNLPEVDITRRAMVLYTSGTTGKPKGVVTTHANIQTQIKTLFRAWFWSSEDHVLNFLPLHHVHGIINVLSCSLWAGACCEFLPKFDEKQVWEIIKSGRLNVFMAVPTVYYRLISYWDQMPQQEREEYKEAFTQFRLMVSGSAALPVSVLEKWESITGLTLLERYGMTEIGMAISNPYFGRKKPGFIGLPLPGVEIRLMGEDGIIEKEGVPGEIQVKGPTVFLEYWKNPEATEKAFMDSDWFKTGDIAMLIDGYYKILGRSSIDIIKTGGYKVSALEVEEVLLTNELINECAVVGIENKEWGEIIVACLVTKNNQNIKIDLLSEWLKDRLPPYQLPRKFVMMKEFPRNALGKVMKNKLKESYKPDESA